MQTTEKGLRAPCPAHLRVLAARLRAQLFLLALAVVTATSAGAQAQVATTGNTDSRSDWTMTEEEGATGIRAAGVAYALDLLGNGNGDYDLGDLLLWIARCRRGEVSCGTTPSSVPGSVPGEGALAAGLAGAGRSGGTGHRRRRASGRSRGPVRRGHIRRRSGAARYGLALLFAATMTWWGCTDDVVRAPGAQADPGFLAVQLTVPSGARDIGAMLLVEGPGIDSVRAPGFEFFQSDALASARRQVIVSGALATGTILELQVPDRGEHDQYSVRLPQVAGDDHALRDLAGYTAVISR